MAKTDPNESPEQEAASEPEKDSKEGSQILETSSKRDRHKKSTRSRHRTSSDEQDSSSSSDYGDGRRRSRTKKRRRSRSSRRRSRRSSSESESEEGSESDLESESESERRRERRRRREKEERRRKEKDRERRKRKREKEERRQKDKKKRKEREKKKEKETGKTGAVTNSWGKYGIIKEIDMWNKRPEFTAWLAEVKQVNLESLSNWEEKQMFKEFMEDHNTATFPSKKYYDLEAFHRRQLEKEMKKGLKKAQIVERTVFDDEEQRRIELLKERERQKEEEVEALKRSMQSGMAQAMKEQARLREEMMYQYRLGNFEAAAAIQKRLDPDAPM